MSKFHKNILMDEIIKLIEIQRELNKWREIPCL